MFLSTLQQLLYFKQLLYTTNIFYIIYHLILCVKGTLCFSSE